MKADLKKDITSIWEIFYLAKQCYQYSEYLHQPDSIEELNEISKNHFLNFTRHIILRILVIELCKLYNLENSNQKFSIPKLLSKLKKGGHFSKLRFNQEKLVEWELKLLSFETSIRKINILRDKLYAHTDRGKPDLEECGFEFKEIKDLIELTEGIIFQINLNLFDTDSNLRTGFEREEMDIVKSLVEFRKMEFKNFWNSNKKEENTNT